MLAGTSISSYLLADFVCHIGKKKPRASEETRGSGACRTDELTASTCRR
jgi:hypothetical protein